MAPPRDALAWFGLGLALVIAAAYAPVLFGRQTFFYRDYGIFGYPLAHYVRTSYWQGQWPLWNPFNNCGLPFLAQWNTMALYPLSLIYILFPLPWSLAFFCLFHLWLAGLGMACLVSHWTGSPAAGRLAGAGYAFNGLLLHSLMWPNNIAAFAWLPFSVLTVQRAWREGGASIPIAAFVAATQMLSGAPEIILFTWLILAGLFLLEIAREPGKWKTRAMRFPLTGALVAAVSSIQLLPFFDLLEHSQRSAGYANDTWAMPAWGLANLILPLFHCSPSVVGVYSQTDQQWTSSYYPGIIIVLLAVAALRAGRDSQVCFLAALIALSILLALGSHAHLYSALKRFLPLLGFIRYPIKFIVLATFAFPVLAAYGYRHCFSHDRGPPLKLLSLLAGAGLLLLALLAAVAAYAPAEGEPWTATAKNAAVRALTLGLFLGVILRQSRHIAREQPLWEALLVLLVAGDGLTQVPLQNPTVDVSAYQAGIAPLDPRPSLGVSRAMISRRMFEFLDRAATSNTLAFYRGHRQALYGNCNLLDEIPKVDGLYSLYLREQADVHSVLYSTVPLPPAGLADFMGISQISSDDRLFQWEARPSFLPWAAIGPAPAPKSGEETPAAFLSPGFDPRKIFYLLPPAAGQTNVAPGKILREKYSPQRIEFEVECAQPSWLVLAQSYYHPWRAFIREQPAEIQRANHAFQAIRLPAGRSSVRLVYHDRTFFCGAIISLATIGGLLFFLLIRRSRGGGSKSQIRN